MGFGVLALRVVCLGLGFNTAVSKIGFFGWRVGGVARQAGRHAGRGGRQSRETGTATRQRGCSIKERSNTSKHCQDMLEYSGVILQGVCTESAGNVAGVYRVTTEPHRSCRGGSSMLEQQKCMLAAVGVGCMLEVVGMQ